MDLLEQYKQQHPEAFREQKPRPLIDKYGRTDTGMIAFVMRLSGGRIRDAKTASYTLLMVAIVIGLISFLLFVKQFGIFASSPEKVYYPPTANTP